MVCSPEPGAARQMRIHGREARCRVIDDSFDAKADLLHFWEVFKMSC